MHIDRSNYEIWFIDWLDGKLNNLQADQLKVFLDQNPDLREEFHELTPIKLLSPPISFLHKELLKKSPSDISGSQFEFLCTAYLENDLGDIQQAELLEIVDKYPDRKKTFDLIQKTILVRQRIEYKHKNLLLKRTTFQKVRQLTLTGLSAAAAISLIIIIFSLIRNTTSSKPGSPGNDLVSESKLQKRSPATDNKPTIKDTMSSFSEKKTADKLTDINKKANIITGKEIAVLTVDSMVKENAGREIAVNKVPLYKHVDVQKEIISNSLIAFNKPSSIPEVTEERNRIGKFISKTFREKLLKEKSPADSPLRGYEIAEAGVTGLNKLFGWQMALDMKNDENGQPKSIYFRSKILKVNAPVKKRDPQP